MSRLSDRTTGFINAPQKEQLCTFHMEGAQHFLVNTPAISDVLV
jgi:hypothetical protein